jgi:competence protein ComEC
MERMKIGCLYLPDIEPDNAWRQRIEKRAEELEIPISYVLQSMKLHFQGGTLDIFAPIGTNTENDGLSLLLSEGDYDILISGDLSAEEERQLLLREAMPDIEVLVAGHHGAKTSTSPQLLQYCRPELLLISVGPNSYGHPTQEVLKRAERVGAKVYRTDEEGTILLTR